MLVAAFGAFLIIVHDVFTFWQILPIATIPPLCPVTPIVIAPNLYTDVAGHTTQDKVDCYAWQTFISLNWDASATQRGLPDLTITGQPFGDPHDERITVWQSYKSDSDMFLPDAATPSDWNTPDSIPPLCATTAQNEPFPVFRLTSPTSNHISAILQTTHDILVDQSGNPVYYDRRINQDEFRYIVKNRLYNAAAQQQVAESQGISLPAGKTAYGDEGAIEIKAAWRVLDGQPSEIRRRYKQTRAYIYDDQTQNCRVQLLGLVGLHIIRKTLSMPDFMWSTFEQIDNVPADSPNAKSATYLTFYNPACLSFGVQFPQHCLPNTSSPTVITTMPATSNLQPVQVIRQFPIPPDIQALNRYVQALIQQQNPDAVWQYYQLVNVRWPAVPVAPPPPGAVAPLSILHAQFVSSSLQPVSNVTLETFVQQDDCLTCHVGAAIASRDKNRNNRSQSPLASDFSFLFTEAENPTSDINPFIAKPR